MAEEIPEVVVPPEPELPEDRPALMTDLLEQSQQTITGHPAATPPDEILEEPPEDTVPPGEPAPAEPPPAEPPAPSFKYANQEEAEKAAQEAARRMHEVSEETAYLRRQVEELQLQRSAPEPAPAAPPVDTAPPLDIAEIVKTGFQQAAQLDPNLENFESQQHEIVASRIGEAIQQYVDVRTASVQQAQPAATAEEVRAMVAAEVRAARQSQSQSQLIEMAAAEGLDVSPPTAENPLGGIHYHDLSAAVQADKHVEGEEMEAIRSVIDVVKQRHGLNQPAPPAAPPAPSVNPQVQDNAPLERTGMGRPSTSADPMDAGPMHLSELLERAQSGRTMGR